MKRVATVTIVAASAAVVVYGVLDLWRTSKRVAQQACLWSIQGAFDRDPLRYAPPAAHTSSSWSPLTKEESQAVLARVPRDIGDCGGGLIGLDPWRGPVQVWVRNSGQQASVKAVSAGQDQTFGTGDDLPSTTGLGRE
jgi:hypothetical protein